MQEYAGMYSPEQLHTLQKAFDLIWMELRANGHSNYIGPSNPDNLREEIARRVLDNHDRNEVDSEQITKRVLSSFGIETDTLHPRKAVRATAP